MCYEFIAWGMFVHSNTHIRVHFHTHFVICLHRSLRLFNPLKTPQSEILKIKCDSNSNTSDIDKFLYEKEQSNRKFSKLNIFYVSNAFLQVLMLHLQVYYISRRICEAKFFFVYIYQLA